ncbi:MAG: hypothetical protein ABF556_10995, partial [Liquorilactobacillus sp.]
RGSECLLKSVSNIDFNPNQPDHNEHTLIFENSMNNLPFDSNIYTSFILFSKLNRSFIEFNK